MKTAIITDNGGNRVEVIIDLKKGDKVVAKENKVGSCDGGSPHHLWTGTLLVKGKTYTVSSANVWDGVIVPRIVDEDGCSVWVRTNLFDLVEV